MLLQSSEDEALPGELGESDLESEDGNIFSIGNMPRNIDRTRIVDVTKHNIIEKGIANWCEHHGFDKIESGLCWLMISCENGEVCATGNALGTTRYVVNITGFARTEKLVDVCLTKFVEPVGYSQVLRTPFDVVFETMENPVAEEFLQVIRDICVLDRSRYYSYRACQRDA